MSLTEYEKDLLDMLQNQIVARGINNPRILEAMQRVPRHYFVPSELQQEAYQDKPLALPEDRATISQPYMVAYMTEQLNCQSTDKVLEIGTGSGYQAAILSHLCSEVYTLERHYTLTANAERTLHWMGLSNVYTKTSDSLLDWQDKSPFDKILVTAASRKAPKALLDQLAEGGSMLIPLGESQMQTLTLITKTKSGYHNNYLIPCVFVPLIWNDHDLTQKDSQE